MIQRWTSSSTPYVLPRALGEADAWTQEVASAGSQHLAEVTALAPPEVVREALRLPGGQVVVARRRIMFLGETPVELTDSYYPQHIAAGTPLAERIKIRGGAATLLAQLGHYPARVVEDVEARVATPEEAGALAIEPETPVLTLLRVTLSRSEEPIEASLMVMKGPRRLRYEMEVT